ncbi:MAG TPA: NEW3 domain-containing protein [Cyclobacteriaceae bacterium]|nr:NEW3 domain-containing protein [Cyclobacteriaceae bacterium]
MSANNCISNLSKAGIRLLSSLFIAVYFFAPPLSKAQGKGATDGKSTFATHLINIEAAVHEAFNYSTTLYNGSSQVRIYDLTATAPEGWSIVFRARGNQITSINIDGGKSETINIEIHPAYNAAPNKYKIPITASASNDTLHLDLEAVVKGSYNVELTTPTGLLSGKITEGEQKEIHLIVTNTGTLNLKDISLSAQAPSKWDATFNPSKLEQLEPGKSADVVAKLTVPDKTLAGDYVITFTAKNNAKSVQTSFRMTVSTSLLSGAVGILIILAAVGLVYFLIRKYGRR